MKDELQEYREIINEVFDSIFQTQTDSKLSNFLFIFFSTTESDTHAQQMYLRGFTTTSIPESPIYTSNNSAKGLTTKQHKSEQIRG